ncbi:MAG: glycosyltransferase family 2 protein [Anaerolineae bacterium]|nr:glycosyltransferase family 2 protein [Anaerolineae bacterium]MDW8171271.1 glycosyltransferase family 2 protein [Anaerolineae bacterium]
MSAQISILLVNYNTRERLRECLDSILTHEAGLVREVLVVDNGSQDGSAEMVRGYPPPVRLIHEGENTWFSGGNNLAAQQAQGEAVFILNPDTILLPSTLPGMLAALCADESLGAVTCRLEYPADRQPQRTCSLYPRYADLLLGYTFLGVLLPWWRARRRWRAWYADWARDSTRRVEVAPGSCILARREALARVGVFDPRQKLYFTEDDLCRRLGQAGYGILFVAEATLLHYERSSTRQVQRTATRLYFDDMLIYCRNWYGPLAAMLLALLAAPTRWLMDLAQRWRGESA